MAAKPKKPPRKPLSRTRVVQAAVVLADRTGYREFSMRGLANALGVVPMALYKHVASREELLDEMVDVVFGEVRDPVPGGEWKAEMRLRALSIREALRRHGWAVGLMESRANPGPANRAHHDAVLGCLREAGFSLELAIHAYSVQDSYIYGFALQEKTVPFDPEEGPAEVVEAQAEANAGLEGYPHIAELAAHLAKGGYDYAAEFEWGLDLLLDALGRLRNG